MAKVKKRGKQPSSASPHWIEYGTHPHEIVAKRAVLMTDGINVYGKRVDHPGQKETNVLRDTVQNNISEIRAAQEQYLAEISKTIEQANMKTMKEDEAEEDD